jgi:Tol biopolymer transport system component
MSIVVRSAVACAVAGLLLAGPGSSGRAASKPLGLIAFESSRGGNADIYVMNSDGSGQIRLTTDRAHDEYPAWSLDGTRIAFESLRNGVDNSEIYVMNVDGSAQVRVTRNAVPDEQPAWSSDGKRIAFTRGPGVDSAIYVIGTDGRNEVRLTKDKEQATSPAWSPSGTKIAFESFRNGHSSLYLINADGSGEVKLTPDSIDCGHPAWSRDGRKIIFLGHQSGSTSDVYTINADGTGLVRLTATRAIEGSPSFSPSGTELAYSLGQIYTINADGSGLRQLTHGASNSEPAWQPTPLPSAVTSAAIIARWRESQLDGAVVARGYVARVVDLSLALRRGGAIAALATVPARGAFNERLRLPASLLPGSYVLRVGAGRSGYAPQELPVRLAAPPEGVVTDAFATTQANGVRPAQIPASAAVVYAHFRFAVLPRGLPLTVSWYRPDGSSAGKPLVKGTQAEVVTFLRAPSGRLPSGRWRCVLRAGSTIVKQLVVPIG